MPQTRHSHLERAVLYHDIYGQQFPCETESDSSMIQNFVLRKDLSETSFTGWRRVQPYVYVFTTCFYDPWKVVFSFVLLSGRLVDPSSQALIHSSIPG